MSFITQENVEHVEKNIYFMLNLHQPLCIFNLIKTVNHQSWRWVGKPSQQNLPLDDAPWKRYPRPCPNAPPPLIWLAVHLCPTAAWVSGWWTRLGCRAGAPRLRVKPPPRHRACTPQPRPLTLSSPSSPEISMPPPPQPLLPITATEPGKAVVPPPSCFQPPWTSPPAAAAPSSPNAVVPCSWLQNSAFVPFNDSF